MATAAKVLTMKRARRKKRLLQRETCKTSEFEQVYRQYFRPLYAFVAYRVANRTAAEDITSQVFEKALRAFPAYDSDRASLSTWLFTIARNCISDHFRQQKRGSPGEIREDSFTTLEEGPESLMDALADRRALASAISVLSSREHEILSLKFGSGMTNRDIGKLLGLSESNTGTILYRSLQKLKNQLESGNKND